MIDLEDSEHIIKPLEVSAPLFSSTLLKNMNLYQWALPISAALLVHVLVFKVFLLHTGVTIGPFQEPDNTIHITTIVNKPKPTDTELKDAALTSPQAPLLKDTKIDEIKPDKTRKAKQPLTAKLENKDITKPTRVPTPETSGRPRNSSQLLKQSNRPIIKEFDHLPCHQKIKLIDLTQDKKAKACLRHPAVIPKAAWKSGNCLVQYNVKPDGRVHNVKAINCTETIFEKASVNAVKDWLFFPQIENAQAVESPALKTRMRFRIVDQYGVIIRE